MEHLSHIHTPEDGRGKRTVFVNGKLINHCFFADTKKGVAKVYLHPFVLDKYRKRCLSRTLRGTVTVEADHGD